MNGIVSLWQCTQEPGSVSPLCSCVINLNKIAVVSLRSPRRSCNEDSIALSDYHVNFFRGTMFFYPLLKKSLLFLAINPLVSSYFTSNICNYDVTLRVLSNFQPYALVSAPNTYAQPLVRVVNQQGVSFTLIVLQHKNN